MAYNFKWLWLPFVEIFALQTLKLEYFILKDWIESLRIKKKTLDFHSLKNC